MYWHMTVRISWQSLKTEVIIIRTLLSDGPTVVDVCRVFSL